jgi:hypothetical protein
VHICTVSGRFERGCHGLRPSDVCEPQWHQIELSVGRLVRGKHNWTVRSAGDLVNSESGF